MQLMAILLLLTLTPKGVCKIVLKLEDSGRLGLKFENSQILQCLGSVNHPDSLHTCIPVVGQVNRGINPIESHLIQMSPFHEKVCR